MVSTRSRIELHEGGAATLIAIGLAVVLASLYCPALPVMTGMALVAAGATDAVRSRLAGSRLLGPAIAAHLLIYSTLYLIFVGAACHAATTEDGVRPLLVIDLGVSAVFMTTFGRKGLATLSDASPS